jgi:PAS domain S-box-containing protein
LGTNRKGLPGPLTDLESGNWPAGASLRSDRSIDESERNFRTVIERLPEGVAIHDGRLVAYANPAIARMLGYPKAADLVGLSWERFVHPDERLRAQQNIERAVRLEAGAELTPTERRLVRHDGTTVTVELSALPLVFDGDPALLVVVSDLTRRKQMEARAQEAQRMAAVGTLAAGVAHEVNNPLAYVTSNLAYARRRLGELAIDDPALIAALRDALDEAYDGIERVRHIVTDLKTFSRAEDHVERIDLRHAMQRALKVAAPQIRHRARIVESYRHAPQVKASVGRLSQVFLNLLVNAVQALPAESPLHQITALVGTDAAGHAFAEVSDDGAGIPPEILSRVFEPFFTTKPVGVGSGLGLTVCRNIIEGYGGALTIVSEIGQGTTVRIALPPAPADFMPRTSSATLPAVGPRNYRVLVVDDEPLVLRAMRRLLDSHVVATAQSGDQALECLARGEEFDVILCDLMMPGMSGMELYDRIRDLGRGLERRIVLVSGGAVTESARLFLERVPNLRFEKPLDPRKIDVLLATAVAHAAVAVTLPPVR